MKQLPLPEVIIVLIEHAIASPFCTRQLADYGTWVIKIEHPEGGDFARNCEKKIIDNSHISFFIWKRKPNIHLLRCFIIVDVCF
ncbi:CoA transferase [Salmonella enterica]